VYKINQLCFDLKLVNFIRELLDILVGRSKTQGATELMLAIPDFEEKPDFTKIVHTDFWVVDRVFCHFPSPGAGIEPSALG
jgi:hypothetical protein